MDGSGRLADLAAMRSGRSDFVTSSSSGSGDADLLDVEASSCERGDAEDDDDDDEKEVDEVAVVVDPAVVEMTMGSS